jgi:hypothetical protein
VAETIETHLGILYRAGKIDVPAEAAKLGPPASSMYDCVDALNVQSALMGDPPILRDLLAVGGEMYDVLGRAVTSLNNCASALVRTADYFASTDDQAARDYAALDGQLKNEVPATYYPPPQLPHPEAPGATTHVSNEDKNGRPIETETQVDSTPEPGALPTDERIRDDRESGELSDLPAYRQDF